VETERTKGKNKNFLHSEVETKEAGRYFASLLLPGDVVFLIGDLGAGKTTFVKGIASYFGIDEHVVSSPTFTYLQMYDHLAHFDLYRLGNKEQFYSMGFDEYFSPPFIALIEWPGLIEEGIAKTPYRVTLSHQGEGRYIEISRM
jgi:tRNA threonylcarbamoyladenosine biosynthesis protein TsaE